MAKLYFKYGAMGSSKTATALITKYNYEERGMRVWLMKPAADRRDGEFTLRSRIGLTAQCEAIGPDCDLRRRYAEHDKVDVIIVDECQFLTGEQIDQLRELVDRENLPVLCFGLRTDFQTKLFPGSRRLFELADSITEIKTICDCGRKATTNARISPDGKTTLRVRLIDSVGYMIPGAVGDTEDGKPRMVTTPWAPEELPMAQAAELGTKKVMEDHSSLGVVVTTDGTVTDIPREDYREAEARAITDMQKTGKPFVVLVNTQSPGAAPAEALCAQLRSEYGVQALAMDCMHMQTQDIGRLLEAVMYAFPVEELRFFLPSWVRALPDGHPVKAALYDAMLERAGALTSLSEAESVLGTLQELEPVDEFRVREVDLGTGTVSCELHLPQALFYEELSRQAGVEIADDEALLQMLQELAQTKKLYDKVQTALEQVKATGYGIVMPGAEELKLEKPEIIQNLHEKIKKMTDKGGAFHVE